MSNFDEELKALRAELDRLEAQVEAIDKDKTQTKPEQAAQPPPAPPPAPKVAAPVAAPEEPKPMTGKPPTTALDILKTNASTAIKTTGANAANRALIDITKRALREQLGVEATWADTPMGAAIIMNLIPAAVLFASMDPRVKGMLPAGLADKLATGAMFASQGAMNQTADQLISAFTPYLTEVVAAFGQAVAEPEIEGEAIAALPESNGAHKVDEFSVKPATKVATT